MEVANAVGGGKTKLPDGTAAIVKIFTANGTWTVPKTGTYRITVIGKGGSGCMAEYAGKGYYYAGSSGGSGGVGISVLSLIKDSIYVITCNNQLSSFGNLLSATAGGRAQEEGPSGDYVRSGGIGGVGKAQTAFNGLNGSLGSRRGATTEGVNIYGADRVGHSEAAISLCGFVGDGKKPFTLVGNFAYGSGGPGGDAYAESNGSLSDSRGFLSLRTDKEAGSGAVIIELVLE